MSLQRLQYKHRIFDDLQGIIHLTETEYAIINSPYFQRLRNIKQLGLAYYVFPGATHTRFSHSIGVLGVADRLLRHLNISESNQIKIRLAALLHDIGHFPLSHTIEEVYSDNKKQNEDLKIEDSFKPTNTNTHPVDQTATVEKHKKYSALHEELSAEIIKNTDFDNGITKILKESGRHNDKDIEEIAGIVCGHHPTLLFNQIMHSDLDIDRMDYLNRDSKNAGLIYGMFDMEYLIESFEVVKFPNTEQEILCVKGKALAVIEDFLFARYHHYLRIIYNRTYQYFDSIAKFIFDELVNKKLVFDYESAKKMLLTEKNLDAVIKFDDSYFFTSIMQHKSSCSSKTKKLIDDIVYRKESKNKISTLQKWTDKNEIFSQDINCPIKECSLKREVCNCNNKSSDYFDEGTKKYYLKNNLSLSICDNKKNIQDKEGESFTKKYPVIYSLTNPIRIKLENNDPVCNDEDLHDKQNKIIALCAFDDSIISQLAKKELHIIYNYCDADI
ncbi:MAG: HD domain-containing protein [Endomicrobium sp.]|jgi:HD superfamily phosphohydrolase|nr:HD domain-containing protein [Endomicrobium sp.]